MNLRQLLEILGIVKRPAIGDCCVLRLEISGLTRLSERLSADDILRSMQKLQQNIADAGNTEKAIIYAYDIGDFLVVFQTHNMVGTADSVVGFLKNVDSIVTCFVSAFDKPTPQITTTVGIACGVAFFPSGSQVPVMGTIVNEAGYAKAAAKGIGVRIGIVGHSADRFRNKFQLVEHKVRLQHDGTEQPFTVFEAK